MTRTNAHSGMSIQKNYFLLSICNLNVPRWVLEESLFQGCLAWFFLKRLRDDGLGFAYIYLRLERRRLVHRASIKSCFFIFQGFFVALKLVALAQSSNEVAISSLSLNCPPPKLVCLICNYIPQISLIMRY